MLHIKHPIIFLDVDGVLNTPHFIKAMCKNKSFSRALSNRLNPLAVDKLQRFVDKYDAVVVISSSWRKFDGDVFELMKFFSTYAIPILGMTDSSASGMRQEEIRDYLIHHYVAHEDYVIFDDDSYDLKELKDHLVKVDGGVGLTDENIAQAEKVLDKFSASLEEDKNRSVIERLQVLKRRYSCD